MINGAFRENVKYDDISKVIYKNFYIYRKGDLGLIHPCIVSLWNNFNKNYHIRGKGVKSFNAEHSTWGFPVYTHKKEEDIPVLLFRGNLLNCGSYYSGRKREYFIVPLRKNEFIEIEGTSLGEIREWLKEEYKKRNIEILSYPLGISPERALEKTIENQWKELTMFNPNKTKICDIPIEFSRREIGNDEVESENRFIREIAKLKEYRRIVDPDKRVGSMISSVI